MVLVVTAGLLFIGVAITVGMSFAGGFRGGFRGRQRLRLGNCRGTRGTTVLLADEGGEVTVIRDRGRCNRNETDEEEEADGNHRGM